MTPTKGQGMSIMNSPRRQVAYNICVHLMNQEPAKQFVDYVEAALIAISEKAEKRAEAAEKREAALRDALKQIAWARSIGGTPRLVKGELIERMERIAIAALEAKP